jgi:hypothetical protein
MNQIKRKPFVTLTFVTDRRGTKSIFYVCCLILLIGTSCGTTKPRSSFNEKQIPPTPDYSNLAHWAAHPAKRDSADVAPQGFIDVQNLSQADVFFLYPTTYTGEKNQNKWNADVNDSMLNEFTDASSILYQSTIFNGVGRIYAPRYRQAHYESFFTDDKVSAKKAIDLAYSDVKKAFEYFLNHENKNRPIILAGHSQGAAHLIQLLKDYFDGTTLQNRLVVAYVVGYPVPLNTYSQLTACENENQTGCICSWRTFKKGYDPKFNRGNRQVLICNPLSWTTDEKYVDPSCNRGVVLLDIYGMPTVGVNGAQIRNNILWTEKPKFRGSFLYFSKNFHKGDFNLFYVSVRENALKRLNSFWKE